MPMQLYWLAAIRTVATLACVQCLGFFFQAEDGIRDYKVTGVQTCALPISAVAWTCAPRATRLVDQACARMLRAGGCAEPRDGRGARPPWRCAAPACHLWHGVKEIGRASCGGRGEISVVAGSLQKKKLEIST